MCLFLTPANKQINYVRALLQTTDMDNCDNYRPISVLPTVSKIVERAAHIQSLGFERPSPHEAVWLPPEEVNFKCATCITVQ